MLKTDPSFLPKVSSTFHRTQDIILPTFYSSSEVDEEREFRLVDVRRSLLVYLDISKDFKKTESLFEFCGITQRI